MKPVFLASAVLALALIFFFAIVNTPTNPRGESSSLKYNVKDLPKHGISLVPPGDAVLPTGKAATIDPYSVILKNTSKRAVVGYAIKWQCDKRDSSDTSLSRDRIITSIALPVFLHGEESDRSAVLKSTRGVISPHTPWSISFDSPAHPVGEVIQDVSTGLDETALADINGACSSITIIADGIFFDDGEFVGPDEANFFTLVKTQLDARYEILEGVLNELKLGKDVNEVFKGLEQIGDRGGQYPPEEAAPTELRAFYKGFFARDILGHKNVFGPDKAIETVQQQLSKPWVKLRKLSVEG
jgi:hypothetical protein